MSEQDSPFFLPFLSEEKGMPICSEIDPELFFPQEVEGNINASYYNERGAKQVCSTCVYKVECLIYAFKNNEIGIWGGTTDGQRKQFRREIKVTGKSIEEIALKQK
jgi:predicted RecB family nuclease